LTLISIGKALNPLNNGPKQPRDSIGISLEKGQFTAAMTEEPHVLKVLPKEGRLASSRTKAKEEPQPLSCLTRTLMP